MEQKIRLILIVVSLLVGHTCLHAQDVATEGFRLRAEVEGTDTIPCVVMRTLYVYPPYRFRNKKAQMRYDKLVRDVKRTLPIAKTVQALLIETYETLQTIPTKKEREKHIKRVEKSLKQQYTPVMKKLSYAQGKLLIKLVDRECNQSSYELVKAFMGSFKAWSYQAFAALFGASLKKEYHPQKEDKMIERIVLMVESGQI